MKQKQRENLEVNRKDYAAGLGRPPDHSREHEVAASQLNTRYSYLLRFYLHRIGQAENAIFKERGSASETAQHLLSECPRWIPLRAQCFGGPVVEFEEAVQSQSLVEFLRGPADVSDLPSDEATASNVAGSSRSSSNNDIYMVCRWLSSHSKNWRRPAKPNEWIIQNHRKIQYEDEHKEDQNHANMWSVILYGSKSWAIRKKNIKTLKH